MKMYNLGPCHVCHQDLYGVVGQHVRFHAECRKEGRQRFGRAKRVQKIDYGNHRNPEPRNQPAA